MKYEILYLEPDENKFSMAEVAEADIVVKGDWIFKDRHGNAVEILRALAEAADTGGKVKRQLNPDSLAERPAAVAAAIKAYRDGACKYTMMDLNQKPGQGNHDRIQELRICDAIRAAEAVALDEGDTLIMHPLPNLERTHTSE